MSATQVDPEAIAAARTRGEATEPEPVEQPEPPAPEPEPEEPEEQPEPVREPEEPEAAVAVVELGEGEPSRKQLRDLDSEQRRHIARVQTIMGGYVAGFEECEHCSGIGLVPPGPKPQTHEFFKACATCAGFGEVLTGSRRAGQESRDCPGCAGRGYVEKLDGQGMPLAVGGGAAGALDGRTPPAPLTEASRPAEAPAADGFGVPSWMGDPRLGNPSGY